MSYSTGTLVCTNLKEGPGRPIVFLHGFLGTAADWKPVCSYLPPLCCIGFDLPGHGASAFMEDFEIDIPRFHLVGYSMGGRIAMRYAKKRPEQVESLIVISAHPGLKSEKDRQKKWENDLYWAKLLFTISMDDFLDRWYDQPIFKGFKPDLTLRRQQNIPAVAASLLHYSLAKQPLYEIEEGIVGEQDEKFRSLFKKEIVIPNAGHAVHLQNPKAVAEKLLFMLQLRHHDTLDPLRNIY